MKNSTKEEKALEKLHEDIRKDKEKEAEREWIVINWRRDRLEFYISLSSIIRGYILYYFLNPLRQFFIKVVIKTPNCT